MAGCWEDEEDEEDEEEWSMRKLSRTRRMRMTPVATTTGTTMKNEKELGAQLKCPTSAFAILGAKIWFKSTKDLDTPSWTYLCFGNIRGNNWFLHKFGGSNGASIMRRGRGSLGVSIPTGPAS